MIRWRNRVVAFAAPRMAAADPPQRQPAAAAGAVDPHRVQRVTRTARREPAARRRAQQEFLGRRQRPAIEPDQADENVLNRVHFFNSSALRNAAKKSVSTA